ncbi:MAG: heterodisulfide reductase-related iron-sulfur binding cluster, partial [Gemmatimonadota bacterium]
MRHRIPVEELGPNGQAMADAVTACVHCGFCLPACPTYRELGEEMDSPRGRIYLMKAVLEGELEAGEVQPHIDRCLGCMACETACPSGVEYHELLLPYRARSGSDGDGEGSALQRLRRWLTLRTLPYPRRFRLAVRLARLTRGLRRLTPAALRPMLDLAPASLPRAERLPERSPAQGKRRARVAMLTGCVQRVIEPAINRATVDVLVRNGVEVVVPERQGCCGALAWHAGAADDARRFAGAILETFPDDVDAIIVNAAGCGSGMREYPLAFAGSDDEAAARELAEKVVDVSVFLDRLGIEPPPAAADPIRIAYHDACHLCHAQGVRDEPRRLLRGIEGVELIELDDGERCCGSAGTYNIDQPEIAAGLGRQKADAVRRSGCDLVATGNIGCMVQMRRHLAEGPGAGAGAGAGAGTASASGSGRGRASRAPAASSTGGPAMDEAARALFERLRTLRKRIADADGVPAYVVFNDATLREMAARRPASPGELLDVSGVGT